jgi:hypothetical protein
VVCGDGRCAVDAGLSPDRWIASDGAPAADAVDAGFSPDRWFALDGAAVADAGLDGGGDMGGCGVTVPVIAGRTFVFSLKYRTEVGTVFDEYVRLGFYRLDAGGTGSMSTQYYRANANLPPTASPSHHGPMGAPYGGSCTPGFIQKPTPQQESDIPLAWQSDGCGRIKVTVGAVGYDWDLVDTGKEYFQLAREPFDRATGNPVVGTVTYSQGAGFGYLADEAERSASMSWAALRGSYESEYYANNATVTSEWWYRTARLSVSHFQPTTDPNVRSFSQDATVCGVPSNPGMWCETSLLLNDTVNKLVTFLNGGHDYNMNGCLDETDHTQRGHWAYLGNTVDRGVWIEYSWELDGYPLLYVGRYWTYSASDPRIEIAMPMGGESWTRGETRVISWTSANAPAGATVGRINYWIGPCLVTAIAAYPAGLSPTGSMSWTIPAGLPICAGQPCTTYTKKLQVILTDAAGHPIASSVSQSFTLN